MAIKPRLPLRDRLNTRFPDLRNMGSSRAAGAYSIGKDVCRMMPDACSTPSQSGVCDEPTVNERKRTLLDENITININRED